MNIPALHGNWVDLAIIFIIFFYLLGWKRGFLFGLIDLLGFVFSFICALRLYSFFGELLVSNFSLPKGLANAAGFFIAGILAEVMFSALINYFGTKFFYKLAIKKNENKKISLFLKVDRALGVIPALGEGLIFTAFILTLVITLPIQPVIKREIASSKIGGVLIEKSQVVEKRLNAIFGEAVNETLTFLTINPNPDLNEKVDLRFRVTDVRLDESAEQKMLNLINEERIIANLPILVMNEEIRSLARDYAKDMFARGYFSHYNLEGESPFDRMNERKILYTAAGENLALAPNVELAHQGLMNSPGHRANILSEDFRNIGIGVIDGGIYGEMFVQEFTN